MRLGLIIFFGGFCGLFSLVLGSYDSYGTHLDSYPAAPVHNHQPHGGGGHNAGSYYHYHVPLVGQQQQQPYYHHHQPQQDNHHALLWPLLLLLALPLLFLPLLPLLLLPIGLSLLALLMPMMMMGMMMMMMMMGGMMPMMRSLGGNEMRTIGELLLGDMTTLVSKYARSIDLDKCPERLACEIGCAAFPESASRTQTAKAFMNYIVDNAIPKGRAKRLIRQYREALWSGSKTGNCTVYHCQPAIRVHDHETTAKVMKIRNGGASKTNDTTASTVNSSYFHYGTSQDPATNLNSNAYNYNGTMSEDLTKATSYYNYYGQNPEDNEVRATRGTIHSAFGGTPVVKA